MSDSSCHKRLDDVVLLNFREDGLLSALRLPVEKDGPGNVCI